MRKYTPLFAYILLTVIIIGMSQGKLMSGYIQIVIMYIGINILLSSSLNIVNGYMGEFACGHAAFMAVGAYVTSVLNVWLFTSSSQFGNPVLPPATALFLFPVTLFIGGIGAAFAGLLIAIPSFKTRDDYLAIITLAVNYIVKSAIENIQVIGGARGFMGMNKVINAMDQVVKLPWIMLWILIATGTAIWVIYRFVNSTYGKAMLAIRDDEISAEIMGIDTRHIKIVAFMLSAGLAGIAGGLFAHAGGGYVNPGIFTIMKSTECLVMVYLGGMGSLGGSVLSAILFTVLMEVLRPLQVWKWVLIPLSLILLMQFRPEGLMGQRELTDVFPKLRQWFSAKQEEA